MGQKPFALYHRKESGARQNHDFIGIQGVLDFRRQGLRKEAHAIEPNDGDWVPVPFPVQIRAMMRFVLRGMLEGL